MLRLGESFINSKMMQYTFGILHPNRSGADEGVDNKYLKRKDRQSTPFFSKLG